MARPGGDVLLTVCASEARSAEERMRGLAGHAPLAHDEGLVLVFPVEGEVCIVNGGVDFAIDVVLADDAGTVVEVLRGVAAHDDEPRCREVVRRALELSAGVASPVALGDRLVVE